MEEQGGCCASCCSQRPWGCGGQTLQTARCQTARCQTPDNTGNTAPYGPGRGHPAHRNTQEEGEGGFKGMISIEGSLSGVGKDNGCVSIQGDASFEGCICRPVTSERRVKAVLFQRLLRMRPEKCSLLFTGWILHGPMYPNIHCVFVFLEMARGERRRQLQLIHI